MKKYFVSLKTGYLAKSCDPLLKLSTTLIEASFTRHPHLWLPPCAYQHEEGLDLVIIALVLTHVFFLLEVLIRDIDLLLHVLDQLTKGLSRVGSWRVELG